MTNLPNKIILIRHADSENRAEFARISNNDLARPLTKKGKIQSKKIAHFMAKKLNPKNPILLCSPAKRTKQTIKSLKKKWRDVPFIKCAHIAPDCGISGYEMAIKSWHEGAVDFDSAKLGDFALVFVGHQLDLGHFALYLMGAENDAIAFPKGVIVELTKKQGAKNLKNGYTLTLLIAPECLVRNYHD